MNLKFEYITVNHWNWKREGPIFLPRLGWGMGVAEKLKAEVDTMKDICNCFIMIKQHIEFNQNIIIAN